MIMYVVGIQRRKKRKMLIMAGLLVSMMAAGAKSGSMTAFVAEVTNGNQAAITQQQQAAITTYYQNDAKVIGQWEQQSDGPTWKYRKLDGSYLTSAWVEDATRTGVYYFLDASGIMLRSSTTPDGYYVDANGEWSLTATNSTTGGSNSVSSNTDATTEEAQQTSDSEDTSSSTESTGNEDWRNHKGGGKSAKGVWIDYEAAAQGMGKVNGL